MREIIATGKDTEEAIETGLMELNVSREDVNIEIIETSNKGLFGIFGQKDAKVKITLLGEETETKKDAPKVADEDVLLQTKNFVITVLLKMGIDSNCEIVMNDNNRIEIELSGENMGMVIGRRGETLDALQHVVQLYVNKEFEEYYKVTIDTEDYRKKKRRSTHKSCSRTCKESYKNKKRNCIRTDETIRKKNYTYSTSELQ